MQCLQQTPGTNLSRDYQYSFVHEAHTVSGGRVTPHDSARYWARFEAETYDCILLAAPCTSERHVLQQAASDSGKGAKLRWSLRQCEDMAALQVRLLTAALKVGPCRRLCPSLDSCLYDMSCKSLFP